VAQRSPIRSFLSVVPSGSEVGKQSQRLSDQPTSRQSGGKTIQFPNLGSRNLSRRSVTDSSARIPREPGVKLPPMIPNLQTSMTRSNLLLDPRMSSSKSEGLLQSLRDRNLPRVPPGSVNLPSSKEGVNHRSEQLRPSARMSKKRRSGDNTTTSSKSQNSSVRSKSPEKPRQPIAPKRNYRQKRQRRGRMSPLLSGVRLLILGVGLAAIAGTLLSIRNPAGHNLANKQAGLTGVATGSGTANNSGNFRLNTPTVLPLGQEITPLKREIENLNASYSQMTPGVFFVDLDNGAYLDMNGSNTFSAASTIKVPILIALFQEVDAGNVRLDEPLTMQSHYVAGGSGDMQYETVGTEYTVLEVARKMITISDNTATNMLIARLGGEQVLNQRFQSWGLTSTRIQNFLPDIEGTNTTSPKDLVSLMAMIEKGGLLSLRSRDRVLDIMQATENNALLPQGLGYGATIAHKTGNIGSVLADTGMVDMPNGKRYLVSIMVKRPHDDPNAQEFIRQISEAAYKSFNGENGIAGNPHHR
jgi:beta-lactamase class A